MVWQLILSIACIISSITIFYLTSVISKYEKQAKHESTTQSTLPQ